MIRIMNFESLFSDLRILLITILIAVAGALYIIFKSIGKSKRAVDGLKYMKIYIISTEKQTCEAVSEIRRRCTLHCAIGFDCEWVSEHGRRDPIALLQLSTFDGYCALFRLSILKHIPQTLKELLEDDTIYKVGVAPCDDAKYLAQDYLVSLKSSCDLRYIAELCGYHSGGLASLSKSLLGIILNKNWKVRCSAWDAEELSEEQINYAAADAHVAIKMFVNLINGYHNRSLVPLLMRSNKHWDNIHELCKKYADIHFRTSSVNKKERQTKPQKEATLKNRYPHATRSKPLYHNCFLQAPDGEVLCTCDDKKAMWYVEKGLADLVSKSPLTVRLRFEPAGRSVGDVGRYYQLKKENKCVVCGRDNSCLRKNVVPREYRKYFPELVKDRSSHDVVLLCVECHQSSNMRDNAVREELAALCDAPTVLSSRAKYTEDVDLKKLRSAARALLNQTAECPLPTARQAELKALVLLHYSQESEVTPNLLKNIMDLQVLHKNEDYESHGHKVVQFFLKRDGVLRLEEIWREHFLSSMQPRYMPELWSVKHSEERLRIKISEGRLTEQDLKELGLKPFNDTEADTCKT